ncbi:MAG: DUF3990 domain-containing protein [Lachnospiraceae bacterium]|nr:DUF3990 domain-containing protein [Lachnospiraceae bacterium]
MDNKALKIVYHGSTSIIEAIDVSKGKPYKDFGRGFYLSEDKNHAINIALRNRRIEKERFGRNTEAYLYTYKMDMLKLSDFKIKVFNGADLEWVQFVLANRKIRSRSHNFDVVIGPTADDDTMVVINAYLDGLYGTINSEEALSILLKNIEAENLPGQIFIANNNALKLLTKRGKAERL